MLSPKASVTCGLVCSIAAWLAILGGFSYALLEPDVAVQPSVLSPRRFTMAMSTLYALGFSAAGCVLGVEGLILKWCPTRARIAVLLGAPPLVVIVAALLWQQLRS